MLKTMNMRLINKVTLVNRMVYISALNNPLTAIALKRHGRSLPLSLTTVNIFATIIQGWLLYTNICIMNLLSAITDRQAKYNSRPTELVTATCLTRRKAFEFKYSLNPTTNRHQKDPEGSITFTHYNYRIQFEDGSVTSVLVRSDMIENDQGKAVLGKKLNILLIQGDEAAEDHDNLGIKKGDFFINCAKIAFIEPRLYSSKN